MKTLFGEVREDAVYRIPALHRTWTLETEPVDVRATGSLEKMIGLDLGGVGGTGSVKILSRAISPATNAMSLPSHENYIYIIKQSVTTIFVIHSQKFVLKLSDPNFLSI